jgi:hypothetical protein
MSWKEFLLLVNSNNGVQISSISYLFDKNYSAPIVCWDTPSNKRGKVHVLMELISHGAK